MGLKYFCFCFFIFSLVGPVFFFSEPPFFFDETISKKVDPNFADRFGQSGRARTIGALRAERQILASANGTPCSARHELRSRAFLFIVSAECALPTNASLYTILARILAYAPPPHDTRYTPHLLCLCNARAFPLLPAALTSVSFGFVLVRVRVREAQIIQLRNIAMQKGLRKSHSADSKPIQSSGSHQFGLFTEWHLARRFAF